MKVFVTGGSGWIGRAVVPLLLADGHEVLALARSEAAASTLREGGAAVLEGSLEDLDQLRSGAASADAVLHLGYHHDFSQMAEAAQMDRRAIEAFGDVLEGTGKALLVASGVLGLSVDGRMATEADEPSDVHPRAANAALARSLADRSVRSVVVRLPPTVHGRGDHGFIATLVAIARERRVSAYVGEGGARWSAVHRDDAASAFRLALELAPPGAVLHAVAEASVPAIAIATAIGARLGLPTESVAPEAAPEHFGWMSRLFSLDAAASSDRTRGLLGWEPGGPTLLEDLEAGAYD